MAKRDIVTFGIPLMASWIPQDWSRILHQLEATLGSIYAQTDPNFRIILAGTDRPELSVPLDNRFEFISCYQMKPMSREARVLDGVHKRARVAQRLRQLGGGYLMLTDADDLISSRLVEFVRNDRHPNGYALRDGYMLDAGRGLLAPFPFPTSAPEARFDQECGTSAIPFFTPEDLPGSDKDEDNYYCRLMAKGHPFVGKHAAEAGRPLLDFPVRTVCYVRNTGENLSTQGAFTHELDRIAFQSQLDDQVERSAVLRTAELEAEFNLKAAEAAVREVPAIRRFDPSLGLSVAIATYRRPAGLRRLLTALRPQVDKKRHREIVVVNDGSHDEAYAAVVAEFADIIRYQVLDTNQGIAMARNVCLAMSWGTYTVFTDDDCLPPEWWLDWLEAQLRMHPEIDVLVGTTEANFVRRDFRERVLGTWFIPRPWRIGRHDIFVTANVAIRTDLARKVGGFGFGEFAGAGEDTELSLRLHRAGARFKVDTGWTVAHDVNGRLRPLARKFRGFGAANASISRLARIDIPPPAGIGRYARLNGLVALLRAHMHMVERFNGGRFAKARAALVGAWIQSRYVAGFRGD